MSDSGPSDEEIAAIVAAVELTRPREGDGSGPTEDPARWRFSGRWWRQPVPLRRERPHWA